MTQEVGVRVVDCYELSPTQEGMLFHALLGAGSGVDHEQVVITVRGTFDPELFEAAFHAVVTRHAILRSRFRYEGLDRPVQEVLEVALTPVERHDLTGFDPERRAARFEDILRADRASPLDLFRAPVMRLGIVDYGPDEYRVLWTAHHALLDGAAGAIVLREMFEIYDAARTRRPPSLGPSRPYRDYIEFLRGLDLASAESYWRDRLGGFTRPTPIVIDRAVPDEGRTTDIQGVFERRLSCEQTTALRQFARSRSVTLNTLLQAAWAILLHRYSGESDVVFGATRACRRAAIPGAAEMVGLLINTLPIRTNVDPDAGLDELFKELRAQQVELRVHEHTPLVKVQGWSEVPRGNPLFETILVYTSTTFDAALRELDVDGARLTFDYHGQTNFPLALIAYGDDEMLVRLETDRRRVDDAPASRALDHLVTLLTAMPDHADANVHELPLMSGGEGVEGSAGVVVDEVGGVGGCLHVRFEEWARLVPGRVAVVCDGVALSYGELDRRANGLALVLRGLGVGPGVLVGLRTERSLGVVVGILGVLKAGGAYVPLDPAYPRDRVQFMLGDSGVGVVVTERAFGEDFVGVGVSVVFVDECEGAVVGPEVVVGPEDVAYVMYTSGSTGVPKGVLISHRNVTRLFDATDDWFGFSEGDVWSLFHSYAFDFSVWEMWGALLYGGRLVVVPFWVSRSPQAFWELVVSEGVTVLNQTPSAFRQLIAAEAQSGEPVDSALRYVIFGGEALELSSLGPWFDRHGDRCPRLVNMYGITETTVHVTYRPITIADLQAGAGSVIGVAIPDLRVVVLDGYGSPVPTGVAGEMYVGGGGVSRGYLDRPELTAQRFVPNPFGEGTLYRTGDLARRLENGDLEYLGRIDDQVKIRGFRIELGEIEAVLARHPAVADAVVLAREDHGQDKRLVAYLIAANHDQHDGLIEQLKDHLRAALPEYMVPAHYLLLDAFALTPNGKTDRKALPAPDYGRREEQRPYHPPHSPTEHTLTDIWATVLGIESPGIHDDFFDLGGDSMMAAQVVTALRAQFGVDAAMRHLFERPTIAGLAEVIDVLAVSTASASDGSESDREEIEI